MSDVQIGIENSFGHAGRVAQESYGLIGDAAMKSMEPSVLYKPTLFRSKGMWCAMYGKDIETGCCGYGPTPEAAMTDFNNHWGGC